MTLSIKLKVIIMGWLRASQRSSTKITNPRMWMRCESIYSIRLINLWLKHRKEGSFRVTTWGLWGNRALARIWAQILSLIYTLRRIERREYLGSAWLNSKIMNPMCLRIQLRKIVKFNRKINSSNSKNMKHLIVLSVHIASFSILFSKVEIWSEPSI